MKYIIIETYQIPVAIVFSELLQHDTMGMSENVISAGYCNINGEVWGKSVSLNKKSRPEDKVIILDTFTRSY